MDTSFSLPCDHLQGVGPLRFNRRGLTWALRGLLAALLALLTVPARAIPIPIMNPDGTPEYWETYVEDFFGSPEGIGMTGPYRYAEPFRITPINCSYNMEGRPAVDNQSMGFNGTTGCSADDPTPRIRFDRYGYPFALNALQIISDGPGFDVESNLGSVEHVWRDDFVSECIDPDNSNDCTGVFNFGPAWRNVTWVDFVGVNDIGKTFGTEFDNIVATTIVTYDAAVSSPGTLALLLSGLLGAGVMTRYRRSTEPGRS